MGQSAGATGGNEGEADMPSTAPWVVVCTDCCWWDWAVGCAEGREVSDPRVRRGCLAFAPDEHGAWQPAPTPPRTAPRPHLVSKP